MYVKVLQNLLYSMQTQDVKNALASCSDSTILHIYAYNYNWNNGFDIPLAIINNSACTLGTALMIFYLADGYRYLTERNIVSDFPEWFSFVSGLYERISAGTYTDTSIAFSVPLSKVQVFKLKKQLAESEQIFVTPIDGENFNIPV